MEPVSDPPRPDPIEVPAERAPRPMSSSRRTSVPVEQDPVATLRAERDLLAESLNRRAATERDALELARLRRLELERAAVERARLQWDLDRTRQAFARFRDRRAVRLVTGAADHLRPLLLRRSAGPDPGSEPGAPATGSPARPATMLSPGPLATGTVGAGDPAPALLVPADPGAYRSAFLARLAATPGTDGLRIVHAARDSDVAGPAWPDVVVLDEPSVDVRSLARHVVTVGRIRGDAGSWLATGWFDQLDVVLVPDQPTAADIRAGSAKIARVSPDACDGSPDGPAVRDALAEWVSARRFAIMVQAPTWDGAKTSGDYFFARGLQRQLERRGHPTSVYLLRQWPLPATAREDIVLHLRGRYDLATRPTQVSSLWILYHPQLVTPDLLDRYDRVFVASDGMAADLASQTMVPVEALHQATDPERFKPDDGAPNHELLFVGNSRGTRRTILDDLGPTSRELAVYGGGWDPELLDPRYLRGTSVPNERLGAYYRAAGIVLNDHWVEAAAAGLITNRLYDTLAAGGFAMSDPIVGLEAEFDGGVVTYDSPADLALKVERYLADPGARRATAERGRAAVLERHTFGHRVDRLLEVLLPLAGSRAP